MAESNNATQLHNKSFPFHVEFYFIINMASFMKQDKERRNQQQQQAKDKEREQLMLNSPIMKR